MKLDLSHRTLQKCKPLNWGNIVRESCDTGILQIDYAKFMQFIMQSLCRFIMQSLCKVIMQSLCKARKILSPNKT